MSVEYGLAYADDDDDDDDREIDRVDFAMMGPDEVRRRSVGELKNFRLYERTLPKMQGPNDPAMGPGADRRIACATCGNKVDKCPGHMAHVEMPYPMYHAWLFSNTSKILRCVCFWCCRLLMADTDPRLKRIIATTTAKSRLQHIFLQAKAKKACVRCKMPQPMFKKTSLELRTDWTNFHKAQKSPKGRSHFDMTPEALKKIGQPFTAAGALQILSAVPDIDYARMGIDPRLSHPSFQILQAMAIGPPTIRPSISSVEGSRARGQDDLTCSIADILAQVRTFSKAREKVRRYRKDDADTSHAARTADAADAADVVDAADADAADVADAADAAAAAAQEALTAANTKANSRSGSIPSVASIAGTSAAPSAVASAAPSAVASAAPSAVASAAAMAASKARAAASARANVVAAAAADVRKERLLSEVIAVDRDAFPRVELSSNFTEDEVRMLVEATEADLDDVPKRHLIEMQGSISVLQSNSVKGVNKGRQRSGKNRKSIQHRFKGKGGRWRLTIGGKRVDFSARTVIGPDPFIPMDTICVPEKMCNAMTIPARVTDFNLKDLTERVRRGPNVSGGALQIVREDGTIVYLEMVEFKNVHLRIGDTVHRHVKEGDYAIFNRQPSLHKLSTMAFKVRPMAGSTIRFNWVMTTPYNADFDGDEMNLHFVQDPMAEAELRELMIASKLAVNPANNKTAFGPIQDAVLGSWLLTHADVFFTRAEVMQLMMQRTFGRTATDGGKVVYTLPPPAIWKPAELWTGRQVFSVLLPAAVNMMRTIGDGPCDALDGHRRVLIRGGELLSGTVDKSVVGIAHGSLNQVISRDCGEAAVVAFNSDLVRVINYYNQTRGFSVGYGDCIVSAEAKARISEHIDDIERRMAEMAAPDIAAHIPHAMMEAALQATANKSLQIVGGEVKKSVNINDNSIMQMVRSGAKGNDINPVNICGLVGQQNAGGKRIAVSCVHKLPRFAPCSKTPEAHAFIKRPYGTGLPADQFFYHCICGCDGLVDTACNTAETGYLQRRLQKAMECIQVYADGTLRRISDGQIVALSYGADGCDAALMEKAFMAELEEPARCDDLAVSAEAVAEASVKAVAEAVAEASAEASVFDMAAEMRFVTAEAARFRKLVDAYIAQNTNILTPRMSGEIHIPVPILRLLATHVPARRAPTDLKPSEICKLRKKVNKDIRRIARRHDNTMLVRLLVQKYFSTLHLIVQRRATRAGAEALAAAFVYEYERARVAHGEMVGSLASDSLGAPATQMTLNTFHLAGVAATSLHITQGVPRLKEILAASKKVNTPSMKLALKPPFCHSEGGARLVQRFLEHLVLDSVVLGIDGVEFLSRGDFLLAMDVAPFQPIAMEDDASNIVIRLKLATELLLAKSLGPADVKRAVDRYLNGAGVTYCSDYGERQWYIGIRLRHVHRMAARVPAHATQIEQSICRRFLRYCLPQCFVAGVPKVKKAIPMQENGRWFLQTQGSALAEMKFIPFIDFAHSHSNHVYEVGEVMGLDVAAQVLHQELNTVLTSDGQYVNQRHIRVLVDTITHFGWLMPVSRHGINRVEQSTFSKLNFEEQIDVLNDATLFAHSDRITGVTETNTVGATGKFGTGSVQILYDRDADARMQREAGVGIGAAMSATALHTSSRRAFDDRPVHLGKRRFSAAAHDTAPQFGYDEDDGYGASASAPASAPASASEGLNALLLDFARDEDIRAALARPQAPSASSLPQRKRRRVTFADEDDGADDDDDDDDDDGMDGMDEEDYDGAGAQPYSPSSPAFASRALPYDIDADPEYQPSSPQYEPSSPQYEPSSPQYEPSSPQYEPSSPQYEPSSPQYEPSSLQYDPTGGPAYSPQYMPSTPPLSPAPAQAVGEEANADRPYTPPDDMADFTRLPSLTSQRGPQRSGDVAVDDSLRHQRPYSPAMDDPQYHPLSPPSPAPAATAAAAAPAPAAASPAHKKKDRPKVDHLPFGYE